MGAEEGRVERDAAEGPHRGRKGQGDKVVKVIWPDTAGRALLEAREEIGRESIGLKSVLELFSDFLEHPDLLLGQGARRFATVDGYWFGHPNGPGLQKLLYEPDAVLGLLPRMLGERTLSHLTPSLLAEVLELVGLALGKLSRIERVSSGLQARSANLKRSARTRMTLSGNLASSATQIP